MVVATRKMHIQQKQIKYSRIFGIAGTGFLRINNLHYAIIHMYRKAL